MSFRVLSAAELEALEAAIWYDDQRPNLGDEFLAELRQAFTRIQNGPLSFGRLEQLTIHDDIRRCLLNRFPYLVVYRCRPEEILVVAVSHARRKPFYWLERIS